MLASVMRRFGDGEIDVLLCTTIIESGLDIPNANTIVIDDAHRLGLAQLISCAVESDAPGSARTRT